MRCPTLEGPPSWAEPLIGNETLESHRFMRRKPGHGPGREASVEHSRGPAVSARADRGPDRGPRQDLLRDLAPRGLRAAAAGRCDEQPLARPPGALDRRLAP